MELIWLNYYYLVYFCSTSCIALMISSIFPFHTCLSFFSLSFRLSLSSSFCVSFFSYNFFPPGPLCCRDSDAFAPSAYHVNVQWTTGEFMKAKINEIILYTAQRKKNNKMIKKEYSYGVEAHLFHNSRSLRYFSVPFHPLQWLSAVFALFSRFSSLFSTPWTWISVEMANRKRPKIITYTYCFASRSCFHPLTLFLMQRQWHVYENEPNSQKPLRK